MLLDIIIKKEMTVIYEGVANLWYLGPIVFFWRDLFKVIKDKYFKLSK